MLRAYSREQPSLDEDFQPPARQLTSPAVGGNVPHEGFLPQIKRLLVGEPIPSHLAHHERFSRLTGLAVLSSDALSSVAYAHAEILRVLVLVGVAALTYSKPIALVIAAILAIVVFSYRQTIHAYPSGGGAYIVAKDNLGEIPSLIAASSLLIDYVLTVAVSIAAGVAAITSAFPQWHVNRVELTLGFVLVLMLGNLRGIRESGRIFAAPTYFFVVTILALLAVGPRRLWRSRPRVLRGAGGHDADPGPGGEHGLRRFSEARIDPGARSLRAASVHEPGRPARVLERDRRPQRPRRAPARRVRRRHA